MLNSPLLTPWPHFEEDEIKAATAALKSGKVNYWTGELGKQFEQTYAKIVEKSFGLALSNGTVALELALRAFGVGPGDEVIVASRSYVASASCVLIVGAKPIFADVDLESGNISAEKIEPLITSKTKAVIPVHIGGLPCDMQAIMALARVHNIKVIEDCAQAHGASIGKTPVGGWGDAAIFSFCQDKIISTGGEGGLLVLNDETAYKKAWSYKDIGRDFDAVYHQSHPPGFRWYTHSAGSNFRMTELQAAIGLLQLNKLPRWIERRTYIANKLMQSLKKSPLIRFPKISNPEVQHAYYRTYGVVSSKDLSPTKAYHLREQLVVLLNQAGVPCFQGSCSEIYLEKAFEDFFNGVRLPNARLYSETAFCLLCHHTITNNELERMQELIEATITIWQSQY